MSITFSPSQPALMHPKYQHGNTTIEFALLFIPFFGLFYAIVSYGFVFLLLASFSSAAEGGARAAIAVDPTVYTNSNDYIDNGVTPVVRQQVAQQLNWLPGSIKTHVLGTANAKVGVTYSNNTLVVTVGYQDYAANPVVPLLNLPFIGEVPKVPGSLIGTATTRI